MSGQTDEGAARSEERHRPTVLRSYEGGGIVVHWEPSLCIHVANCIRRQPGVFDSQARPWIDVSAASADDIAEAVRSCPTGALTYRRTDGTDEEAPETPTAVQARRNGPLFVRGALELLDADGKVIRAASRMALCRCGASENKPFCDLTHRAIGFEG